MTVPSVVVFDLGKVLVDFDYGIAAEKIAKAGKITPQAVRELIDLSPLLLTYERGALTSEQFYQEVRSKSGFAGGFEDFCGVFADIFWEIEPMIALQARLQAAGIPTWIFSNTNDIAIGHIRRRFPFFSNFTGYVYSYEQGAMKPEAKIYEVMEKQTGQRGPAMVYMDDREENIAAGAARGWQTIWHKDPAETRRALQAMGLPA